MLPLVTNDAYAGPFYVYLFAGLQKLGAMNPMLGRAVVLVTGTFTVPLAYAWAKSLSRNRLAAGVGVLDGHGYVYIIPFAQIGRGRYFGKGV